MSVASLCTPCFVMFCVFLYGPFCHGTHKLDFSTLFTTFFSLNISSFYITQRLYSVHAARSQRAHGALKDTTWLQQRAV